jgi:hypothetical protein
MPAKSMLKLVRIPEPLGRTIDGLDELDRLERALLADVDGHRSVIELESLARALHLGPDAIERLCSLGLVAFAPEDLSPSRPGYSGHLPWPSDHLAPTAHQSENR